MNELEMDMMLSTETGMDHSEGLADALMIVKMFEPLSEEDSEAKERAIETIKAIQMENQLLREQVMEELISEQEAYDETI